MKPSLSAFIFPLGFPYSYLGRPFQHIDQIISYYCSKTFFLASHHFVTKSKPCVLITGASETLALSNAPVSLPKTGSLCPMHSRHCHDSIALYLWFLLPEAFLPCQFLSHSLRQSLPCFSVTLFLTIGCSVHLPQLESLVR